ncbi:hypothetical protein GQR58_019590 [Nymphon striatum]|nr:hypothetical protein GQR58_019590 [Nymphon striatum]
MRKGAPEMDFRRLTITNEEEMHKALDKIPDYKIKMEIVQEDVLKNKPQQENQEANYKFANPIPETMRSIKLKDLGQVDIDQINREIKGNSKVPENDQKSCDYSYENYQRAVLTKELTYSDDELKANESKVATKQKLSESKSLKKKVSKNKQDTQNNINISEQRNEPKVSCNRKSINKKLLRRKKKTMVSEKTQGNNAAAKSK